MPASLVQSRYRSKLVPYLEGSLVGLLIFVASAILIAALYRHSRQAQVNSVRAELERLARQAASFVDPEIHRGLRDPAQMETEEYDQATLPLARFHRSIPEIIYVYTMIRTEAGVQFVLDTSNRPDWLGFDREMEPSALMDIYEEASPIMIAALESGMVATDEEPYTDEFGTFISGYAPIRHADGQLEGMVGVDLELSAFNERLAPVTRAAWRAGAMSLAIAIVVGFGLACFRLAARDRKRKLAVAWMELDQSNSELREAKEVAESAALAKTQFLATMSHEIRTPLNGLVGVLHLLEESLPEGKRPLLRTALNCSDDLLRLIGDVLDLSKIEAGKMTVEIESVSPERILEGLRSLHAPAAQEKGLELRIDALDTQNLNCLADPFRLRQVLTNLTMNAVKFTEQGSVTLGLSTTADGKRHRFSVTDTGIGIEPEVQNRLFQPFSQANSSTTRQYGGTGLGLSICRRLAALMDGEIGVDSEIGRGSTFWIELPTTEEPESVSEGATAISIENTGARLRILLVDDNPTNRLIGSELLCQRCHVEPDLAENGSQAMEFLAANTYDLVLMDCMMPDMDGYEATRAVRNGKAGTHNRDVPIVALTANAMLEDRQACLEAGMNDHLSKPILPSELARVLKAWGPRSLEIVSHKPEEPAAKMDTDFDPARLTSLYGEDGALIGSLLDTFLECLEETMGHLNQAIADTVDPDRVRFFSHQMKGSAADFGAYRLSELAGRIEEFSKEGHAAEALDLLDQANQAAQRCKDEIVRYQESIGS